MRTPALRTLWIGILRFTLAAALPLVFTAGMSYFNLGNSAVISLCLVGFILAVSAWWGWQVAVVATLSGAAGLALNILHLAVYSDLIIFLAFNVLCLGASHFWTRSQRETRRAEARGGQLENLQRLSRSMLSMTDLDSGMREVLEQIQASFHLRAVAVFELGRESVFRPAGALVDGIDAHDLQTSAVRRDVISRPDQETCVVPLVASGAAIGSLGICGPEAVPELAHAVANVLALGMGRLMALRNSTKAEAARRGEEMKATVLDALAHNFKTPLTSVRAAVSSLREIPSMYPEQARELLAVAEEETERLQAMIAEAVETARIDARRQHLQKTEIPITTAIERALESVGTNLRRHDIHFDVPLKPPYLHADPDLLNHVLIQLFDNAAKYSPEFAIIVIGAREVEGGVEVSVSNPGPGIPPEEAKHVFERFYRGREAGGKVPGAGIGLSIAKAIVEAHGGTISVVSVPNLTTTFRFTLPAEHAMEGNSAQPEQVASL